VVSVYELVTLQTDLPGKNLVELQKQKKPDPLVLVRCPSCQGLRGVSVSNARQYGGRCKDCKRGKVVPRVTFCSFWAERFSTEEITQMAKAIWG
jgi:hypothetical protein